MMNKKMQIEMIKENIEEVYEKLMSEECDSEMVSRMLKDIEILTVRLKDICC